ncbi:uncharacterized protein LOC133520792 [Cydia pomonella]|uniref:uncharacterized protein LOC133520792 n=1 Tax=Cydia pomonella TaxID=82600 RepID=UPI002ADD4A0C|nr:uncharacterized protein LOC133520792 [Cydia pomonella]
MAPVSFLFALVVLTRLSDTYSLPYNSGNGIQDSWPRECEGRNYCWIKTDAYRKLQNIFDGLLRGKTMHYRLGDEDVSDRDGQGSRVKDIGRCKPSMTYPKVIYMIKDEDGTIWYVPQTTNYTVEIEIEECEHLGPILEADNTGLDPNKLSEKQVHCVEQRVALMFPVLYHDDKKYKIKLLSPPKGLPLSCSTKIVNKL